MQIMVLQEQTTKRAYSEEEDYTWPKKELLLRKSAKENRSALGLVLLVIECFIPEGLIKQAKKISTKLK